jgi:FkbH-like protein
VFIDDNVAELAEVQAAFPEIACIQMPADPADWLNSIQSTGALDRLPPTAEDLMRASYYQQELQRAPKRVTSSEAYLAQLHIEVAMFMPTMADIPRLAQLVAKTNQFNLNCRRRSTLELSRLCAEQDYVIRLIQARDCFGDYGIVGACIAKLNHDNMELDTFVMSCRAMGRGVEEAMLVDLFAVAAKHGRSKLVACVEECPRNEPARLFFARFGCETPGVCHLLRCPQWPSYMGQI